MHPMIPRFAALALLLAGCADDSNAWTKPGATENAVSADLGECRGEARALTRRDAGIDADIMATRSTDWQRTGTLGLKRDEMAQHGSNAAQAIVARCMAAKGYRPAE